MRPVPTPAAALAAAALLAAACGPSREPRLPAAEAPWAPAVEEIPSPAGVVSLAPSLGSTGDGGVLLSWVEPTPPDGAAVRLALLEEGRWSDARSVAQGTNVLVNAADVPVLLSQPPPFGVTGPARLVAAWLALDAPPGQGHGGYGVRLSTSPDRGGSWFAPLTPHRDASAAEHGFVSGFTAADGTLVVSWLDGRGTLDASGAPSPSGATALLSTTVSPTGTLGLETVVDERACDCCPTACARTRRGAVLAWRDRDAGEIRDISVATWRDGAWSAPRPIFPDGWTIDGCPVNGPALSAVGDLVVAAWFTAAQDKPRVHVAFSDDGGERFGKPQAVDGGAPEGRPAVALLPDGAAIVAWIERADDGVEVRLRKVTRDGLRHASFAAASVKSSARAGTPRLLRDGSDLILAWTTADSDAGPPRVRTSRIAP